MSQTKEQTKEQTRTPREVIEMNISENPDCIGFADEELTQVNITEKLYSELKECNLSEGEIENVISDFIKEILETIIENTPETPEPPEKRT